MTNRDKKRQKKTKKDKKRQKKTKKDIWGSAPALYATFEVRIMALYAAFWVRVAGALCDFLGPYCLRVRRLPHIISPGLGWVSSPASCSLASRSGALYAPEGVAVARGSALYVVSPVRIAGVLPTVLQNEEAPPTAW